MGTALQGPLLSQPGGPTGPAYPTQGPHLEILNNVGHQRPPRPSEQDPSSRHVSQGSAQAPGSVLGGELQEDSLEGC